jgi:hypothetical protein
MKKILFYLMLLGSLISCAPTGQVSKAQLEQIFDKARSNDCQGLAPMVIYAGRNMDRSYRDTYHISDSSDMQYINKLCTSIASALNGAMEINYARFASKYKTGTQRDIWEIWVSKEKGVYKYFFDFITSNSKAYLIEAY